MIMYETRNDLPEATRAKVAELLGPQLAGAIDLRYQAKQAHWNVKGPNFIALHKLFDDVAEECEKYVDVIAERIVQLGGAAEGTIQSAAKRTPLRPYPLAIADGAQHVDALADAIAAFAKGARQMIARAAGHGDHDTADILTKVSRGIDKQLWFVEAHAPPGTRAAERAPRKKQVA
jgi:starvation-inducible DNA-binding protein